MRSEVEIIDLILSFAQNDNRVRAVLMTGSRTNINAPKDKFQDYDIAFLVTDMQSMIIDDRWLETFGKQLLMQKPEAMSLYPPTLGNWFSYLMLFEDGNRIDLMLVPLQEKEKYIDFCKGLVQLLLDKDDNIDPLPPANDKQYHVQAPTKEFYEDCINEFLWLGTYVVKGLYRKEIVYANHYINDGLRPCLLQMWEWKIGIQTNFTTSIGKNDKHIEQYISTEEWSKLLQTYTLHNYSSSWKSLFILIELFESVTYFVASTMRFDYPKGEIDKIVAYLKEIYSES